MNTELIRKWIDINEPKGREKLAAGCEISISLVDKILRTGHEPGLDIVRRLAKTMDVSLDELGNGATESEQTDPAA